jgi:hypothetical protein
VLADDGRISSAQALLAIRDVRIRGSRAVLVWLAVYASLSTDTPAPLKVKRTARYLRLNRRRVREAFRLLAAHGYLRQVEAPSRGTAGLYVLGATGFGSAMRARTGARPTPVADGDTLPLFPPAA